MFQRWLTCLSLVYSGKASIAGLGWELWPDYLQWRLVNLRSFWKLWSTDDVEPCCPTPGGWVSGQMLRKEQWRKSELGFIPGLSQQWLQEVPTRPSSLHLLLSWTFGVTTSVLPSSEHCQEYMKWWKCKPSVNFLVMQTLFNKALHTLQSI